MKVIEQTIYLILIVLSIGSMIYLNVWKPKKEAEYNSDEWELAKKKADTISVYVGITIILFLVVSYVILIILGKEIDISANRLCTYSICLIGSQQATQLIILKNFDNKVKNRD